MVGQHFSLAQLPSLVVTRWDVLPGDNKHDCFPVRDPVYLTNMKMELTYKGAADRGWRYEQGACTCHRVLFQREF